MSWVRLDDAILDNAKIAKAGVYGFALHVAAITWCARNLTDGIIPTARVTALLALESVTVDTHNPLALIDVPSSIDEQRGWYPVSVGLGPLEVAAHLVEIGLWHDHADGYEIHDYLKYNPSKEQVLAERESWKLKKSQARASTRDNRARPTGSPNKCPPETPPGTPPGTPPEIPESVPAGVLATPVPVPIEKREIEIGPSGPHGPVGPDVVRDVFNHWLAGWERTFGRGRKPILDKHRRRKIQARLAEKFTAEDLKKAIDGLWGSSWYIENRRTDIELICRDAEHVERFLAGPERPSGVIPISRPTKIMQPADMNAPWFQDGYGDPKNAAGE